ncbi:MAG: cytochrome c nitrite reductase small subunit [Syntrophobacteraceae bacterium]
MKARKRNLLRLLVILALLGAGIGIFMMFGPPKLLAKSSTPDFCSSCHVMESQYEAWFHEGAHRGIMCVDCHLPHQNVVAHYLWKSIDGMKDVVVFYSGRVPETIEISERGQDVLKTNCIRCHEMLVDRISTDRNCWDCHRRLAHIRSGTIGTR